MTTHTHSATDERIDDPSTSQHKYGKHQGGCAGKHKNKQKKAEHKKANHQGKCGHGKAKGQRKHDNHTDHQPEDKRIAG